METPDTAQTVDAPVSTPSVVAVVIARRPGDLSDVLGAVVAQVYDPVGVFVVGQDPIGLGDTPVRRVATMREMVGQVPVGVDYLWVVDQDARPRPDTLRALVSGSEQIDASVAGSKLLKAEAPDELVSVGAATDVFGVPYTGLDAGEVDQEQYDVVRDIAFVEPASMLIRRDLFTGLGGLDTHMPFESAGIDLCQRARLNGARVVVVPSAEVLLVGAFPGRTKTWREQAGRLRGMLKSYSLLTLLWAVPGLFLIGLITSIHDTFRQRPLALWDFGRAWAWNVLHIGSTAQGRVRARSSRQAGDEELFRYQIGGSVDLKAMASGLSDRLANPDEEATDLFERDVIELPGFWQQPSFIAGIIVTLYIASVTRSVWTSGLPVSGFSLPLRDSALASLANYAGGWNPAELGSPTPMRPVVGATALIQLLLLSKAGLASAVITTGSVVLGVVGMARLLRLFGVGPYARSFSGLVLMTGPAAAYLAGTGAWPGLVATGLAPWAIGIGLKKPDTSAIGLVSWLARIALASAALAAFAPVAIGVPMAGLLFGGIVFGGWRRVLVGSVASAAGLLALMPWVIVQTPESWLESGTALYFEPRWWVAAWIAATVLAAVALTSAGRGRLAAWGAVLAAGGLLLARSARLGIGRDVSVAGLILASLGLAAVTAVALSLDTSDDGVTAMTRMARRLGAFAGIGMVVLSLAPLLAGRVGLPSDTMSEALGFASTRAQPHGSDRILLVGPTAALPGEVRRLADGTAYRTIGGPLPHLDEAWPDDPRLGDEALAGMLEELTVGGELRPGTRFAEFGIRWVVFTGPTVIEQHLSAQLDLRPLPDLKYPVFENDEPSPRAVTDTGVAWSWVVPGYEGRSDGETVRIAENADARWGPGDWQQDDWANAVAVGDGTAGFTTITGYRALALLSGAFVLLLVLACLVPTVRQREVRP
ncbi:MAG: hypothetical protein OEM97_01550 [Acidimicrobiia bacterium]|nr:hypothetical protein [Acidimicrobiia bacterium]